MSVPGVAVWTKIATFLHPQALVVPVLPSSVDSTWAKQTALSMLNDAEASGSELVGLSDFLVSWLAASRLYFQPGPWALRMNTAGATLATLLAGPTSDPRRVGVFTDQGLLALRQGVDARGTWLLKTLMCQQIPPPPLASHPPMLSIPPDQSRRQAMQSAMSSPVCTACHSAIDPPGFALEHFDLMGNYRDFDNGLPVDSSGTLREGQMFSSIDDLAPQLAMSCDVALCFTRTMMNYALVVGPGEAQPYSDETLNTVATEFANSKFSLRALILAIVGSPAFLGR